MSARMSAPAVRLDHFAAPAPPRVHTVWEVCQRIRALMDHDDLLPEVWVRGEVSNAKRLAGGHLVFTLKDDHAALGCMMWREHAQGLSFEVRDGVALLVRGRVTLYEGRGQVQLYADELVPDGLGKLHVAFEQLKERLAAEGLFDRARKKPLPAHPRRIGVVTSLQGAALRDVLRILAKRYPLAEVVVRPARVQGEAAAQEVAQAIALFNARCPVDLLIVGRGGGSLEDLWAFNEEVVARAIAASRIPVVSAVGHETDTTIADFVADARAPTPSGAAETVVPDQADLLRALRVRERALGVRANTRIERALARLENFERRAALRKPQRMLDEWRRRLEDAGLHLADAGEERLRDAEERLARAAALLDSYSPLRTLERGYSIVTVEGKPATRAAELRPGTRARLRLADGEVPVVVDHGGT